MPTPVKMPATVTEILDHGEGVKSFIMEPQKKCPRYKPGQFLHFALDGYDPSAAWPESRVFSIVNSPTRRERLRITFAIKGRFTQRMYDEVDQGDVIWLKLPYGHFILPGNRSDLALVAGGTGITPFVSYLEHAIDNEFSNSISLFYGFRNPRLLIF